MMQSPRIDTFANAVAMFMKLYMKELRQRRWMYLAYLVLTALFLGTLLIENPFFVGYTIALHCHEYDRILSPAWGLFILLSIFFPAFIFVQSLHDEIRGPLHHAKLFPCPFRDARSSSRGVRSS